MEDDIENLLNKWYNAKQELFQLEKKIEKYKVLAENLMNKENIDVIKSEKYILQRKEMNRTTIGKKDLPEDIWNRYSKELFYNAFYISKKNEKSSGRKKKSSRKKLV
jgi:hypothetical protein